MTDHFRRQEVADIIARLPDAKKDALLAAFISRELAHQTFDTGTIGRMKLPGYDRTIDSLQQLAG